MPIKDVQTRFAQVGVIRLGTKGRTQGGKEFPKKLETLRFTSASRALIEAVSEAYGGTVEPWQAPSGPQFEVVTTVKEIPVLVPPQRIDANYELWGNGYRSRLCDGETERVTAKACVCSVDRRDCKPTTRLSLMLAEILSLGTWKLESHGWNAAAELPMLADAIANAPHPIPGRLEVQRRNKKVFDPTAAADKQVQTRDYMVPVLHFDFVTPTQAFGGQIGAAAQAALDGGNRVAIESAPAGAVADESEQTKLTAESVTKMAAHIRNVEQLQQLWKDAKGDGVLTDEVKKVLEAKATALDPTKATAKPGQRAATDKAAPAAPTPRATPATAPIDDVVDAEIVEEPTGDAPDADAVWTEILRLAKQKNDWSTPDVEAAYRARMGHDPSEEAATGWKLAEFRDALKAGEVK